MKGRQQAIALRSLSIVEPASWGVGIDLPAGTFLAHGSPLIAGQDPPVKLGHYLVDASSGDAIPIPVLGDVFVQG